jgi:hypothetical protein
MEFRDITVEIDLGVCFYIWMMVIAGCEAD